MTQLGMVGLGRMGANMAERLSRAGIDVRTYDPQVESTAGSLEELVGQLEAPRSVWLMVPAARARSLRRSRGGCTAAQWGRGIS